MDRKSEEELREDEGLEEELRLWASYRGQTLTRTGMLSLLCDLDSYSFLLKKLNMYCIHLFSWLLLLSTQ